MKWYYYLHENGDLIGKNPVAYNESDFAGNDFVTKHWYIETEDRGDAWTLVIEAFALGARIDKIKDLAVKWSLTKEDLKKFIIRNLKPTNLQKDGMDKFIQLILCIKPNEFWDNSLKEGPPKGKQCPGMDFGIYTKFCTVCICNRRTICHSIPYTGSAEGEI